MPSGDFAEVTVPPSQWPDNHWIASALLKISDDPNPDGAVASYSIQYWDGTQWVQATMPNATIDFPNSTPLYNYSDNFQATIPLSTPGFPGSNIWTAQLVGTFRFSDNTTQAFNYTLHRQGPL